MYQKIVDLLAQTLIGAIMGFTAFSLVMFLYFAFRRAFIS